MIGARARTTSPRDVQYIEILASKVFMGGHEWATLTDMIGPRILALIGVVVMGVGCGEQGSDDGIESSDSSDDSTEGSAGSTGETAESTGETAESTGETAESTGETGSDPSGADCGWTAHTVGESQHSLASSEYFVYVPPSYDPTVPMPLVVALHGTGGNGKSWLDSCGVRSTADSRGFIVASPSAWDNAKQFAYDENGENQFMDDMMEEVRQCYNVDTKRQYMFGFSQGGFYSIFYCLINHETSMTACGGFGAHAPWEGFNMQYNDEGRQLPFYLVTGADDTLYIDRARDFEVGLDLAGYPHFFDDPAGLAHACPSDGLAPMYDWWQAQGPLP